MSIPGFQSFLLPVLQVLVGRNELHVKQLPGLAADNLGISAEDRLIKLQSGQTCIYNRACWAVTYLRQARLVESPKRGMVRITSEGKKVLGQNLDKIDMKFLERYPSYVEFKNRRGTKSKDGNNGNESLTDEEEGLTPDESIEQAYQAWRQALVEDILETVKNCKPDFFENLVVELLVAMGYGGSIEDAGKAVGKTADGGVDGRIKEDRLGLDEIVIQAKKWDSPVSRPEIQSSGIIHQILQTFGYCVRRIPRKQGFSWEPEKPKGDNLWVKARSCCLSRRSIVR